MIPCGMRSTLSPEARSALAEQLARCGEVTVSARCGAAPTTLRKARDGARLNPTTIYALNAYLALEAIAA